MSQVSGSSKGAEAIRVGISATVHTMMFNADVGGIFGGLYELG